MFFLGTTFFSGRNTIDPSPAKIEAITKISLASGTYDQIFASKNPDLKVENGYDNWDFDTILNADYDDGTLDAGNSGFSLHNTDVMLVKCRQKGTMDWTTIFAKEIHAIEDFKLNLNYYYNPSKQLMEYMIVSTCNGVENSYAMSEVFSDFDGIYLADKDNIYGTVYDLDCINTTVNTQNNVLTMLNSEYPTVIDNNGIRYESCTTGGCFIRFNQDTSEIDLPQGLQYRHDVKKWLNNRKPKILKFYDGRIWLIRVTGNVQDSAEGHNAHRKITFDWVEIGDVNHPETLYLSGLSDVGREWWY